MGSEVDNTVADVVVPVVVVPGAGLGDGPDDVVVPVVVVETGVGLGDGPDDVVVPVVVVETGVGLGGGAGDVIVPVAGGYSKISSDESESSLTSIGAVVGVGLGTTRVFVPCASPTF